MGTELYDIVLNPNPVEDIEFEHSDAFSGLPGTPQNFTATANNPNEVDVSWDAVVGDSDSYTVYVKNTSTGSVVQTITGVVGTSTTVFGLTNGVTYEFWVTNVVAGIESEESNHDTATPQSADILPPPFELQGTAGDTVIDASVGDYPVTVDQYNWYLDGSLIGTSPDGDPTFQFSGLTNSQEYRIGCSVTVNGVESTVVDWQNYILDTGSRGHPESAIGGRPNQYPQIYYHNDKSYVMWQSNENPSTNYIFSFDHVAETVSSYQLATTSNQQEPHLHAQLAIDSVGNIYAVVEDFHNNTILIFKSDNPEDISSFSQINTISGDHAYAKILIDDTDTIYIITRNNHDSVFCAKSDDGFTTMSTYTVYDGQEGGSGSSEWAYNGFISAVASKGIHLFINIEDRTNNTHPDCYYLHSSDGKTWGNIEFFEGAAGANSKDVSSNGALVKSELNNDGYGVITTSNDDKYNRITCGIVDSNDRVILAIQRGDFNSTPQTENWELWYRDSNAWQTNNMNSITTLGDVNVNAPGIVEMEENGNNVSVYSVEDVSGVQEITKYTSDNFGISWQVEEYVTRDGNEDVEGSRISGTYNHRNQPKHILAWGIPKGTYSDIGTNMPAPALFTPVAPATGNTTAIAVDGVNDYVDLGDTSITDSSNVWTIMFWCRVVSDTGGAYMFSEGNSGNDTPLFGIRFRNGVVRLTIRNDAGSITQWDGATNIQDGLWHHVALTYDGTDFRLYIDGSSDGVFSYSSFAGEVTLDRAGWGALVRVSDANHFDGILDELQVWNDTLSETQINTNKAGLLQGDETNLLHYWNCEDQAASLTDLAGANDGSIVGATYETNDIPTLV